MRRRAAHNSTYPKGGVSYSKDSFVVKIATFAKRQNVIANGYTIEILHCIKTLWFFFFGYTWDKKDSKESIP
jgi:hypothetical protein